jgi:hypothetical protein
MNPLHFDPSGQNIHKLGERFMHCHISVIKKRVAFELAQFFLTEFKQALDHKEIDLDTARQLDDILPSHELSCGEKSITYHFGIIHGIFF